MGHLLWGPERQQRPWGVHPMALAPEDEKYQEADGRVDNNGNEGTAEGGQRCRVLVISGRVEVDEGAAVAAVAARTDAAIVTFVLPKGWKGLVN